MSILLPHQYHIINSPWMSIPEVTDAHGKENEFSCPAQAWSVGTLIDALHELFRKLMK